MHYSSAKRTPQTPKGSGWLRWGCILPETCAIDLKHHAETYGFSLSRFVQVSLEHALSRYHSGKLVFSREESTELYWTRCSFSIQYEIIEKLRAVSKKTGIKQRHILYHALCESFDALD